MGLASLLTWLLLPLLAAASDGRQASASTPQTTVGCAVTMPNGIVAGEKQRDPRSYGNDQVSVFGLWPNGTVLFRPGGAGFVTPDGSSE
jgi:hypothetical protein